MRFVTSALVASALTGLLLRLDPRALLHCREPARADITATGAKTSRRDLMQVHYRRALASRLGPLAANGTGYGSATTRTAATTATGPYYYGGYGGYGYPYYYRRRPGFGIYLGF